MGGILAVQAALQKPELIQALVLVATSGGIDLSTFDVADWRQAYQQTFAVLDGFTAHQQYLHDQLHQIQCPVLLIWEVLIQSVLLRWGSIYNLKLLMLHYR